MILKKILGHPSKKGTIDKGLEEARAPREEIKALFKISTEVKANKDSDKVLELITQQALTSLKAHRTTVFALDEKSGVLKTLFTSASDPLHEQVGLFEEKEVARKVIKQKKTFSLQEAKDFSEFFKYEERERKITSLISIPIPLQGKNTVALSAATINGSRKFDEVALQLLSIFANYASLAAEMAYLQGEVHKGNNFRKEYEKHLDDILTQLLSLSNQEQRRIEEHIGSLFQSQTPKAADKKQAELPASERIEKVDSPIALTGELGIHRQEGEPVDEILRVEIEEESLNTTDDLINGGVFIRTPNPLDLGEYFPMKLYLSPAEDPVEVNCKVIWTNKYGHETKDLRRGMGVKFVDLEPKIQKRVEKQLQVLKLKWNEAQAAEKTALAS